MKQKIQELKKIKCIWPSPQRSEFDSRSPKSPDFGVFLFIAWKHDENCHKMRSGSEITEALIVFYFEQMASIENKYRNKNKDISTDLQRS